jgi:hypothetical protein
VKPPIPHVFQVGFEPMHETIGGIEAHVKILRQEAAFRGESQSLQENPKDSDDPDAWKHDHVIFMARVTGGLQALDREIERAVALKKVYDERLGSPVATLGIDGIVAERQGFVDGRRQGLQEAFNLILDHIGKRIREEPEGGFNQGGSLKK